LYAKENVNLNLKEFIEKWKIKNKNIITSMYIEDLELRL